MTKSSAIPNPASSRAAATLAYVAVPPLLLGAVLMRQSSGLLSSHKARNRRLAKFGGVQEVNAFVVNATFGLGVATALLGFGALAIFAGGYSQATDWLLAAPGVILLCHAASWYVGELLTSTSLSRQLASATPRYWPTALIHGGIGWGAFGAMLVFA